jgi:hypothetical protein
MNTTMRYIIEGLKDYERADAENRILHAEIDELRQQLVDAEIKIAELKGRIND